MSFGRKGSVANIAGLLGVKPVTVLSVLQEERAAAQEGMRRIESAAEVVFHSLNPPILCSPPPPPQDKISSII